MRQRYFAWLRIETTTNKRNLTNSMMWSPERTLRYKRCATLQFAGNTMYLRCL